MSTTSNNRGRFATYGQPRFRGSNRFPSHQSRRGGSQPSRFNHHTTNRVSCQICGQGHSAINCPRYLNGQPRLRTANNTASSSTANTWLLDSGASDHITNDLGKLSIYSEYDGTDKIVIGDGKALHITHVGSGSVDSANCQFTLSDILCVPDISRNLISVAKFCRTNHTSIEFFPFTFLIKDLNTGAPLLQGECKDDVYEFPAKMLSKRLACVGNKVSSTWHQRLGHPANHILSHVLGSLSIPNKSPSFCDSCACNKSHKLPFGKSTISSSRPLEIIFSDIWGPAPVESFDGFRFYVVFVDHFTRYSWFFPLKHKSDLYAIFHNFRKVVENRFNAKITTLYTDNGAEYLKLGKDLPELGIQHQTSPPYTPEHIGLAERKHRHIVETGLTLLHHAKLPNLFWTAAFQTAMYLINRLPTPVLDFRTPFQCLFNQQPNYQKLKIFGCRCYPWIRPMARDKLQSKSISCIFLGYSTTQSAYKCLDPHTNKIYMSRHVQFDETTFPSIVCGTSTTSASMTTTSWPLYDDTIPQPILSQSRLSQPVTCQRSDTISASNSPSRISSSSVADGSSVSGQHNHNPTIPPVSPPPSSSHNIHPMLTRSKNNIFKPKIINHTTKFPLPQHEEPTCITHALKDENWRLAMSSEFDALVRNVTWDLVPPNPKMNVVGCKWIYRIKRHPDGSIDRYKARLVAKGFHQQPGVDYKETFSPVIKPATVRIVLSTAVSFGWPIQHLDVNNAFLQGHLDEDVYMTQPPGFVHPDHPTFVCKLRKAIYGLKQAPRAWYTELKGFLLNYGFKNTTSDTSLFVYRHGSTLIYFLVYVDDILLTGNDPEALTKFHHQLANRFSLKDLGSLHYFLGIEVHHHPDGLLLTQSKYVRDLLHRFNMDGAKPVQTPMQSKPLFRREDGSEQHDTTEYRSLVGALQYLALTRPDISFAVNKLAQFMSQPTITHWSALKRVLRYLKSTIDEGILIHRNSSPRLYAYSDADLGGNLDDFRSTSAYIVFFGSTPVSWKSSKQQTISRSSTEAEYKAIAAATSELSWISNLLTELHISVPSPPKVYCDNLGANYFSANPSFHSRMKHLALNYHFVRELVATGRLQVLHVSTTDQVADMLTKSLSSTRLEYLKNKIGVTDRNTILRGRIRK